MQEEGLINPKTETSGALYFDPLGINTLVDLTTNMVKRVAPGIRKRALENYLKNNEHDTYSYKTKSGLTVNIWDIKGSDYNKTEFHIAEKLAMSGHHVLFPNQGAFGKGRKNDVYLYDTKTYIQQKVELKALFGETAEVLKSQIISGTGQASVIAYDIQSNIKKMWLIDGLRKGWGSDTKKIILNYKGQWYEIDRSKLYDDWLEKNLR